MSDLDMNGRGSTGNIIAALCSVFVPGLGQLVQGRFVPAIAFFLTSIVLWCCCLGWIPHIWSIVDAAIWKATPNAST
jgi:TM2 domain-containing membrane protein YozV